MNAEGTELKNYGWLDTNCFVHPLCESDPHRKRCIEILDEIKQGNAIAWIDPLVVHELTYVLSTIFDQFQADDGDPDRDEIFSYISSLLSLEGMKADDKELLMESLMIWSDREISFTDARLIARSRNPELPVCSVNESDFVEISNSYPSD